MKNIVLVLVLVLGLLFSSSVLSGTQEGQITQILVRASDNLHYFYMSGVASDRAGCASGQSYWMIKDENTVAGKSHFSLILAAYAAGKTVKVTGTVNCTRWGDGEDVDIIHLK